METEKQTNTHSKGEQKCHSVSANIGNNPKSAVSVINRDRE